MDDLIRVAHPDDAADVQSIYAPIVANTPISFETEVPGIDEMRRRITTTLEHLPWLVAVDNAGRVSGYVYASRHRERAAYRWSVDVTVYVREDCRGRGIGRRLYEQLFEMLQTLGYCQAFAGITLPNEGSVALHESVGFNHVGVYRNVGYKHSAWQDVGWWQKVLQSTTPPIEPVAFAAGRNPH